MARGREDRGGREAMGMRQGNKWAVGKRETFPEERQREVGEETREAGAYVVISRWMLRDQ